MQVASVSLKNLFFASLVMALASLGALGSIDTHIKNMAAPAGIVSFELCAYSEACSVIAQSWGPHAQLMAALSLGVDYLFMVAYPAAICFGLLLLAECVPPSIRSITVFAARASWVAGAADAVENYCLAQMLLVPAAQQFAWPASIAATVKFAFLAPTLGWLLLGFLRYGLSSRAKGEQQ